jgi:hypothetical protein
MVTEKVTRKCFQCAITTVQAVAFRVVVHAFPFLVAAAAFPEEACRLAFLEDHSFLGIQAVDRASFQAAQNPEP